MRIFNIKHWFTRDSWFYIGEVQCQWTITNDNNREVRIYYHLFKSIKGKRKCEFIDSGYDDTSHHTYRKVVFPWLKGAPDSILEPYLNVVYKEKTPKPDFKLLTFPHEKE